MASPAVSLILCFLTFIVPSLVMFTQWYLERQGQQNSVLFQRLENLVGSYYTDPKMSVTWALFGVAVLAFALAMTQTAH